MDNQTPGHSSSGSSSSQDRPPTETTRSRWTPKPEQILILESIFNSGTVNPPKDETVRIRKLLEKFGAVGDANVFYWFQNRRSRSRRRQRQMQAGLTASDPRVAAAAAAHAHHPGGVLLYDPTSSGSSSSNSSGNCFFPSFSASSSSSSSFLGDDSSADDLFSISRQLGFTDNSQTAPWDVSQLYYQSGTITAFINGIPSEFPRGPIDMKATFGHDALMLVHSSGELLPVNEYGVLMQSLRMGESYFLVSLRFQGQVSLRPSCIRKDEDMCLVDLKWDP